MTNALRGLRTLILTFAVSAFAGLSGSAWAGTGTGADAAELERTWASAPVYLPTAGSYRRLTTAELTAVLAGQSQLPSVVIYVHGCSGLGRAAVDAGEFLASAGYLVIEPDSFARLAKPKSCDPAVHRGGLHREVLGWRHEEVKFSVRKLRALAGASGVEVFLMGFSEGAIAVATFIGEPVRARIIEGWTCHAGWQEYRGLPTPPDEPVLALVARDDPWFRLPVLQGDCGAFMTGRPLSRSIVYDPPSSLHEDHWLSWNNSVRREIVEFLSAQRSPRIEQR